jgi:acryloyl-coenzyme A reductase
VGGVVKMMKAAILTKFGGPDAFQLGEMPVPSFRGDQLLIKVHACGVCGHDVLNREGHFPVTVTPCVMGHEIAGSIEAFGDAVSGFKVGQRVALTQRVSCGRCSVCLVGRENLCRQGAGFYGEEISGGYGEYVIANPRNVVELPEEIDAVSGSILSCAIGTGFHALRRAQLKGGETVVVTGASGGVGLHAVDLAVLFGYRVIAVVRSEASAAVVSRAGADDVLIATDGQFHNEIRELTDGKGANAVLEISGSPTFASSVKSVIAGGRVVNVGNVVPTSVELNPALTILKELQIVGSGHATADDLRKVVSLVARGRVVPRVSQVFDIDDVSSAHEALESGRTGGRIVLRHH